MDTVFFSILSYLMGSFPTGLVIGKVFYKKDIREFGSKNIGGTNAKRVFGKIPGLLVEVIDVLKVFIPTFIAASYGHVGINMGAVVGVAGMLGHCCSVFIGFEGGKGVACFFGMITALNIWIGAAIIIIWKTLKHALNYVSLASIISCFLAAFAFLLYYGFDKAFIVLLFGAIIVTYKHKANIKRLMDGTESKVNPSR
jgi:glycerol-3-phosphate acyltransferase PlsY